MSSCCSVSRPDPTRHRSSQIRNTKGSHKHLSKPASPHVFNIGVGKKPNQTEFLGLVEMFTLPRGVLLQHKTSASSSGLHKSRGRAYLSGYPKHKTTYFLNKYMNHLLPFVTWRHVRSTHSRICIALITGTAHSRRCIG